MSSNSKRKRDEQLSLKFPKPSFRDERRRRKLARVAANREFQDRIKGLDGGLCQNLNCSSSWYWKMQVRAHHITYLSDGGTNEDHNGIALCAICHRAAHKSRVWVLNVLLVLRSEFNAGRRVAFRWEPAIVELERKIGESSDLL